MMKVMILVEIPVEMQVEIQVEIQVDQFYQYSIIKNIHMATYITVKHFDMTISS